MTNAPAVSHTRTRIVQVDAFADAPFRGNPAAVCVLRSFPSASCGEAWLQNVALEMNLSETAFLWPEADGFRLRWFTPAVEVDLCGHATVASAHVLWQDGHLNEADQARFYTRSGMLTADRDGEWIELDFPAKRATQAEPPAGLLEAFDMAPVYVGKNQFDYLLEFESEEAVRALTPDHALLKKLPVRGVIATARSTEYDFISRFFAPGSGIEEDPVTGSAHTALGPYWAEKLGKSEMLAFQASKRGGVVRVRMAGDRVKLGGKAVTVLVGELLV